MRESVDKIDFSDEFNITMDPGVKKSIKIPLNDTAGFQDTMVATS